MAPPVPSGTSTRRTALRAGGSLLSAALAGCQILGGDSTESGTPHPDKGHDSYGLVVRNETDSERTVDVKVGTAFGEDTPLDKTVTVAADATRSWNSLVTKEKEYAFVVALPKVENPDYAVNPAQLDATLWVEVGNESYPPAPHLVATIDTKEVDLYADKAETPVPEEVTVPRIKLDWPEKYQTPMDTPG